MADQEDQNKEVVNTADPAGQSLKTDSQPTQSETVNASAENESPSEEAKESSSNQHEKESESSTTSITSESLMSDKERKSTKSNSEVDLMHQQSIYYDTDIDVDPAAIEALTDGFVTRFLPSLEKAKSSIDQIRSSQLVLIETVQQETSKFTECEAFKSVEETMLRAKQYHNKLLKLGREMNFLCEKSKKLKKRALKLQQQKQKEELTRAHDLEKEYEKERMLTAKVASSTD